MEIKANMKIKNINEWNELVEQFQTFVDRLKNFKFEFEVRQECEKIETKDYLMDELKRLSRRNDLLEEKINEGKAFGNEPEQLYDNVRGMCKIAEILKEQTECKSECSDKELQPIKRIGLVFRNEKPN